jgi:hypothetical protein
MQVALRLRRNHQALLLALFIILALIPCGFAQNTIAQWTRYDAGSNCSCFKSTTQVPHGSEVRVRVVRLGTSAPIRLVKIGATGEHWTDLMVWNDVRAGYIEKQILADDCVIAIMIGSENHFYRAESITHYSQYDVMKFDGGWEVDTKVVSENQVF